MTNYGVSVTHKFKTEVVIFRRGIPYTREEIIKKMFKYNLITPGITYWENVKRIDNAIKHGCRSNVRHMVSRNTSQGKIYMFL